MLNWLLPRRKILHGGLVGSVALAGINAVKAADIYDGKEMVDVAIAADRYGKSKQLTDTEKDALRISTAFLKAWEKPNAATIASFFSTPCTIKYGGNPNAVHFEKAEDTLAHIAKTISGGNKWESLILDTWVKGTVVVHEMVFRVTVPNKGVELHPDVFTISVKDGKVRQWLDFNTRRLFRVSR